MHYNERFLQRLAHDRTRELALEARTIRQSRISRLAWRARLANSLMGLATRLEPSVQGGNRQLARQ